jgi:predicted glycosyltransferase
LICFEAISKEKPSLIVPTKHQLEQEANAKRMQELDLAVCVEEKDLETKLSQAIGIMDERKDSFSAKLRELREYAERLDGVETTVKDIESFV